MRTTRGARWAIRCLFLSLSALGMLGACSSNDNSGSACDQFTYEPCSCSDSRPGYRHCDPDGGYGRCECGSFAPLPAGGSGSGGGSPQPGTGGSGTGGSGGSGTGGSGGSGTGGSGGSGGNPMPSFPLPPAGVLLSEGSAVLIDVFATTAGVLAVRADGVELVGRDGTLIGKWPAPREVTAAAFDGERLVVADRELFTTLGPDLAPLGGGQLAETCASAVAIGGGRFVCGPQNDWDRVFVTYDQLTGATIESSAPYTYNGIPMRRVPGTDNFVTVTTDISPSDFHLYRVDASGKAVYVGESPYHGDFSATATYAFDGSPPKHLITHQGLMLEISPAGCVPGSLGCFIKDGDLGTLGDSQRFAALTNDGAGVLSGLVDLNNPYGSGVTCASGCLAQRIDVPTHTVLSQKPYTLGIARVVAAAHDAASSSLVLGYGYVGESGYPFDPPAGYRVELLAYQ